jgi:hypothetical protein
MEQELPTWFNHVKPNFESYLRFPNENIIPVPLNVLQIGAYKGDTTQWLLDNKNINRIVDVDTWEGSIEHEGTFDLNQVERVYDERFTAVEKVEKRKGWPDRLLICPNGEVAWIEFKKPGGSLRPLQAHFQKTLCEMHFVCLEIDNLDLFKATLKSLLALPPRSGLPSLIRTAASTG